MTGLTRRAAMLGTAAAVAMATVPAVAPAQATDILVAMERRMLALQAVMDGPEERPIAECDAAFEKWYPLQDRIAEMPAATLQGLAVKLRLIAYTNREHDMGSPFGRTMIRTTVESAERLAGEAGS